MHSADENAVIWLRHVRGAKVITRTREIKKYRHYERREGYGYVLMNIHMIVPNELTKKTTFTVCGELNVFCFLLLSLSLPAIELESVLRVGYFSTKLIKDGAV